MTTSMAAKTSNAVAWRARDVASWLGLAASPTFALMAWIAATDAPRVAICSPASDVLPIDSMAWMYVLMSLFHVSPWFNFVSGCSATIHPHHDPS